MRSGSRYIKRGLSYLKRNGLKKTVFKGVERLQRDTLEKDYAPSHADEATLRVQRDHVFERPYRFSILVPVYETDPALFMEMLRSVGDQTYGNWELILADASRDDMRRNTVREFSEEYNLRCKDTFGSIFDKVVYIKLSDNKGIAANTNEALSHASGDYVALLDHDDILENTALFDIMSAIDEAERARMDRDTIMHVMAVYTDEDKITSDGTRYFDHHVKPDFDPVLLCTNNYICHFFVADTDLAKGVGGFLPGYDGAQDHDFILRCVEGQKREQVIHVPKVLYHWRSTKDSTAENPDAKLYAYEAGRRAVADHFKRLGMSVKVTNSSHLGFFELEYERLDAPVTVMSAEEFEKYRSDPGKLCESGYLMILSDSLKPVAKDHTAVMLSAMALPYVGAVTGMITTRRWKTESAGYDRVSGRLIPRFEGLFKGFSGYKHRARIDQLVDAFTEDCVLLRTEAVKEYYPQIALKDGYDVYYMPKAEFIRKNV